MISLPVRLRVTTVLITAILVQTMILALSVVTLAQTVMSVDWRLQYIAVEFTNDPYKAAAVLTRKQLGIEPV